MMNYHQTDFSLNTNDIPGARPKLCGATKKIDHYEDKLVLGYTRCDRGRLEYTMFNYPKATFFVWKNLNHRCQKKHFNDNHNRSNIFYKSDEASNRESQIEAFDFPRSLWVKDIPGASAGTLKSKFLQNRDLVSQLSKSHLPSVFGKVSLNYHQENGNNYRNYSSDYVRSKDLNNNQDQTQSRDLPNLHLSNLLKKERKEDNIDSLEKLTSNFKADTRLVNKPFKLESNRPQDEPIHQNFEYLTPSKVNPYKLRRSKSVDCETKHSSSKHQVVIKDLKSEKTLNEVKDYKRTPINNCIDPKQKLEESSRMKKVAIYNILSNKPIFRLIPSTSRLPYKYGIILKD